MTRAQVLYVGGWGRSGSTLLSHMLAHVDGHVSVGELRYVWQAGVAGELCGCGRPFAECDFWQAVGARAFGGWDAVDVDEVLALEAAVLRHRNVPLLAFPRLYPAHAERLRRYSELTERLYSAILEVAGARVVVDSTKNPPYAYFLRRVSGVDLRVVHLVRDSRGVVFSWMKKIVRPEIIGGDAHFEEFSPLRAGVRWMECNLPSSSCARLAPRPPGCATRRSSGSRSGSWRKCLTVSTPATTTWPSWTLARWRWPPLSTASAATPCASRTAARSSASTTPGVPR